MGIILFPIHYDNFLLKTPNNDDDSVNILWFIDLLAFKKFYSDKPVRFIEPKLFESKKLF